MDHITQTNPFVITKLVRWTHTAESSGGLGLVAVNQATKTKTVWSGQNHTEIDSPNTVSKIKTHLEKIGFDIEIDIGRRLGRRLEHPIANLVWPRGTVCDEKETIHANWKLAFASHPLVIKWVADNNPSDVEIVDVPPDHKIVIIDTLYGHSQGGEGTYLYILVSPKGDVFHL